MGSIFHLEENPDKIPSEIPKRDDPEKPYPDKAPLHKQNKSH